MKKFFSIEKDAYAFEWNDLIALLTTINVILVIAGFWWAPIVALINCLVSIVVYVKNKNHINLYIMQLMLIILNIFFLRG